MCGGGGGGGGVGGRVESAHPSDNKPWAYICSKDYFAWLLFRGAYFRRGLLLEGILHRLKWVGLDSKNSLRHYQNSPNQV